MTTLTRDRYWLCDDTCTADCGACKGRGRPARAMDPSTGRATGVAEEINGFRVIAEKVDGDRRTILGHRPAPRLTMPTPEGMGHEFVIGHNVRQGTNGLPYWGSGEYFWTLEDAVTDWQEVYA